MLPVANQTIEIESHSGRPRQCRLLRTVHFAIFEQVKKIEHSIETVRRMKDEGGTKLKDSVLNFKISLRRDLGGEIG